MRGYEGQDKLLLRSAPRSLDSGEFVEADVEVVDAGLKTSAPCSFHVSLRWLCLLVMKRGKTSHQGAVDFNFLHAPGRGAGKLRLAKRRKAITVER